MCHTYRGSLGDISGSIGRELEVFPVLVYLFRGPHQVLPGSFCLFVKLFVGSKFLQSASDEIGQ